MSQYFAEIENGIVKRVIVADQEFIDSGKVGDPKNWIETFIDSPTEKYAGIGDERHEDLKAFIFPKPYASFVLDTVKKQYVAPIAKPTEKEGVIHNWDEKTLSWKEVALPMTELPEDIIIK